MKTVLTYGTFDLFHVGHVRILKRLRDLGDRLVVGCSTDTFNATKKKKAIFSYESRAEILMACRYVDDVFPEENWDQKLTDIIKYKADIFAMGDDWAGKFDYLEQETGCKVVYLTRTPDISTTDVKSVVSSMHREKIQKIQNLISTISDQIDQLSP